MDGTFTQCFPRHVQELFARTCVTSLILALSRVSCGGDFLPYRLWKKGNTILWAGNTQKISNTGAFTCSTVQTTSFHVRAWCVPGLQGQAEGGLQASAAVLSGHHGFCHIQARVCVAVMSSVCCHTSWESISLDRFRWFCAGITKGSSSPTTYMENFAPVVLKYKQKYTYT